MIRVLIVEDEAITAEAHAAYVAKLDGFELAGVARSGAEAVRLLKASLGQDEPRIDLILLDMNLPDIDGLELCRRIRAAGVDVDVIAITAVRAAEVVRGSIAAGIVQYLIKPFTFGVFADKLTSYRDFRSHFANTPQVASQRDVDGAFAALRTSNDPGLGKGLSPETLSAVSGMLQGSAGGVSARELADEIHASRVTARRYLEYLADSGRAERVPRYGTPGRPEVEYRWRP
ncbi:response regulator [Agreia sp. COWG]|uniref:response regulator n=1 Tax=Agreia sp. COWG TaxID=2773266 RepID=UPI00192939B2|nr:response regulator [Agreia sp. COWG]CAD6007468.1 Transcriptional regulatory protein [Agreia sp. COWG]